MQTMSAPWRKSSYSANGGQNCVEVADNGAVLIRDTKDNERGPVLRVSPAAWQEFLTTVKLQPPYPKPRPPASRRGAFSVPACSPDIA